MATKRKPAAARNQPDDVDTLTYEFTTELWRWNGQGAAWFFVSMPADESADLREAMEGRTNGFGSVKVEVTVGETTWQTSVFPDSKSGCYILPMKKQVRTREDVVEGDMVDVTLRAITVS